jgi:hypothetical protein
MESTSWGWILLGIAIGYIVSNYSRRSPEKDSSVERQKDPFVEGQFVPVTIVSPPFLGDSIPLDRRPLPNNENRIGIKANSDYKLTLKDNEKITDVSIFYFSHKENTNSNTVIPDNAKDYFSFDYSTSVLTTKNFLGTKSYVIIIQGTINRSAIVAYRVNS